MTTSAVNDNNLELHLGLCYCCYYILVYRAPTHVCILLCFPTGNNPKITTLTYSVATLTIVLHTKNDQRNSNSFIPQVVAAMMILNKYLLLFKANISQHH